jgi:hypothetical protein
VSDAIPKSSGSRKEIQHSTGGSDFEVQITFAIFEIKVKLFLLIYMKVSVDFY